MPVTAKFDFGVLGFSSIPTICPSRTSATPKRSASWTSFRRIFAPDFLLLKILRHVPDASLDDVVAQDDANGTTVGEVFGQTQRVRDSAFAFLVGVVQVLQAEFLAVSQQAKKITRIPAARHHQDLAYARIHQRLDGVVNHRLVVDRKQMLVGDLGEREHAASRTPGENDTLHLAPTSLARLVVLRQCITDQLYLGQRLVTGSVARYFAQLSSAIGVVFVVVGLIFAGPHVRDPFRIGAIPIHRRF